MKSIILATLTAFSLAGTAADIKKELTPEEKAVRKERMLTKTGGMIQKQGVGCVTFINCQKKIATDEVQAAVDKFSRLFHVNVELKSSDGWSLDSGLPPGTQVAIYIVDDTKYPMSLVAVESRWGMMNVAALNSGKRFTKQLTRVITLTIGAGIVPTKASPMKPVTNANDLDKLMTDGFVFDSVNSIEANLKAIGITHNEISTYRRACQEGWAPQPTNHYQKAIWDQVHELPTEPVKIEFDPKKDK